MKKLIFAAVLGTTLTALPAPVLAAGMDAWGHEAAHATGDNYNPGETKLTPAAVPNVRKHWSVPLAAAKCTNPSVPLITGNRLVTASAYRVSGYDAITGKLKWQTADAGRRDFTLAAIVGDTLVAHYRECHSGKAFLTALSIGTGKALYTRRIAAPLYDLLVDRGIVVGTIWDTAISKYVLRAYRISDGAPVWGRDVTMTGRPVSARGRILAFGDDEPGAAFDITTGKRLWSLGRGCHSPIGASPDGTRFYLNCNNDEGIEVVDAATGKTTAHFPSYGYLFGFATDGRRVYVGTLSEPAAVVALDAVTGKKLWSRTYAESQPVSFTTAGGVVYGWRGDGRPVAALEAATGKVLKLDASTSALATAPQIAQGHLYGIAGTKAAPRSLVTAWSVG
ncbi:PQQ-binding-like beta-propeller repeat protein [Actinoplanes sp. NPDC049265]|uniref:outer membrane protein assembly factor BamB family protein n=1 Tax=Actinoplanes sp. NPDC049265 TaxID=3363902 RepID=UPI003714B182